MPYLSFIFLCCTVATVSFSLSANSSYFDQLSTSVFCLYFHIMFVNSLLLFLPLYYSNASIEGKRKQRWISCDSWHFRTTEYILLTRIEFVHKICVSTHSTTPSFFRKIRQLKKSSIITWKLENTTTTKKPHKGKKG